MPSVLEKRVDRVEAAIGGTDESRLVCCATDRDAERTWTEAKVARKATPLCVVMDDGSGPPVRDMGMTVGEMMAYVEVHGRRVHDRRPDVAVTAAGSFHFWHPPRRMS